MLHLLGAGPIVTTVTAVIAVTRGDGDDDDDNTGVCLEDMCLEG